MAVLLFNDSVQSACSFLESARTGTQTHDCAHRLHSKMCSCRYAKLGVWRQMLMRLSCNTIPHCFSVLMYLWFARCSSYTSNENYTPSRLNCILLSACPPATNRSWTGAATSQKLFVVSFSVAMLLQRSQHSALTCRTRLTRPAWLLRSFKGSWPH